ncbi:putative trehalose-phosphate phosphatase 8 [Nymphaea thermarum]|nr:putative trehalose-phosphate phosphatase 8 [Nymphaea thermarum]
MDLKSKHSAPVLTDPAPITKTRLGMHSSLLLYSPSPTILCRTISKKKIIPSKLDDVRSNCWLDSMASSSPPRKFFPKDFNFELATTDGPEAAYGSWMVFEFVGLSELYYAGSHGMDIMGPVKHCPSVYNHSNCVRTTNNAGKEVNLFQPAREFVPMIDEVFKLLVESTKGIKGAKVENNKFCVSVHYRLVDEEKWVTVAQCVADILSHYPRLRLTHGRKVLREGNRGYGILVSSVPKDTNAFYSLRDPAEVMDFLKKLVSWKNSLPGNE